MLQVTDYSLIILIQASRISGTQSYQGVMNAAFGTIGYTILSLLQFTYPFIGKYGSGNVNMHNYLPFKFLISNGELQRHSRGYNNKGYDILRWIGE